MGMHGSPDLLNDIGRLENMIQVMNEKGGDDPEMKELNGTLDKILDIQHPERVKSRVKESVPKGKTEVLSVGITNRKKQDSYFGSNRKDTSGKKNSGTGISAWSRAFKPRTRPPTAAGWTSCNARRKSAATGRSVPRPWRPHSAR